MPCGQLLRAGSAVLVIMQATSRVVEAVLAAVCTLSTWTAVDSRPSSHAQVFDMFRKISLPAGETEGCPPGILPPGWRSAYQARQRTAQIVLTLAKAAPLVRTFCEFGMSL